MITAAPERIDLGEGAEILVWERAFSEDETRSLTERLMREIPWQQREILIMGRRVMQPRLVCWVGDPEAEYTYSGIRNVPFTWQDVTSELRRSVEKITETAFNSVLLNLYRDERDSMGFHQDNEKELGNEPIIASLSLGATRRFQLRHAKKKGVPGRDLALGDGSLILMRGTIQRLWRHGVPKESSPRGPRINLTFRTIYPTKPG
ncbi:MAG: alpha-ketoglutarate-dependent dioxygenase AlkB [Polyangiaceae bacterium]